MFNPYVVEKLIELDRRRATRFSYHGLPPRPRHGNGFALSLGRAMQRAGVQLERWAGSGPQHPADCLPEARRY